MYTCTHEHIADYGWLYTISSELSELKAFIYKYNFNKIHLSDTGLQKLLRYSGGVHYYIHVQYNTYELLLRSTFVRKLMYAKNSIFCKCLLHVYSVQENYYGGHDHVAYSTLHIHEAR